MSKMKAVETDELFLQNITLTLTGTTWANRALLVRKTLAILIGVSKEEIVSEMTSREYRNRYVKIHGSVKKWKKHFVEEFERQAGEVMRSVDSHPEKWLVPLFPISMSDRLFGERFKTVGFWTFAISVYWIRYHYELLQIDDTEFLVDAAPVLKSELEKLPKFSRLKGIGMGSCDEYDYATVGENYHFLFERIAQLPELENLDFYDVDFQRHLKDFAGHPNLKSITIMYSCMNDWQITDDDFQHLGMIPQLEKLALESYGGHSIPITPLRLRALLPLKHLRSLSIHPNYPMDYLKDLAKFPALEELILMNDEEKQGETILTEKKDFSWLKDLPKLKKLSIDRIDESGLKEVAQLPFLKSLSLYGRDLTDAGLAELSAISHLKSLNIRNHNPLLTKIGYDSLCGLKDLEELQLPAKISTEAVLSLVGAFDNLKTLSLWKADDIILAAVSCSTKLETLRINQCSGVTAAGLRALSSLPHLKNLTLYDSSKRYTNADLKAISKIASLTHLDLLLKNKKGRKIVRYMKHLPYLDIPLGSLYSPLKSFFLKSLTVKDVFDLRKTAPGLDICKYYFSFPRLGTDSPLVRFLIALISISLFLFIFWGNPK